MFSVLKAITEMIFNDSFLQIDISRDVSDVYLHGILYPYNTTSPLVKETFTNTRLNRQIYGKCVIYVRDNVCSHR